MNKKMREIKAQIEAAHEEATKLFEAKDYSGADKKLAEIEDLEKGYKAAEKLYSNEKEEVTDEVVNKSTKEMQIKSFVKGIKEIRNTMSEGTSTDGGYTVPEDIQTTINEYKRAKASLLDLVDVETVSTMSGRRTFKKRANQTGFSKVGEGANIGSKSTPQFESLDYTIEKYAGYMPVTNELLADSDANVYNVLTQWLGDESRVTANKLILAQIATKSETEFSGIDDIKKALNVTLGQAFKPTSKIITNDDGLQYLDTLKDDDGKYLLKPNPVDPMKMVLSAGASSIPVFVVPNADLATTDNKVPFIVGDLKEGIKFFDRQRMNIMISNTAAIGDLNAFEDDLTILRAIEREDVKVKDNQAFVNGYIEVTPVVSL